MAFTAHLHSRLMRTLHVWLMTRSPFLNLNKTGRRNRFSIEWWMLLPPVLERSVKVRVCFVKLGLTTIPDASTPPSPTAPSSLGGRTSTPMAFQPFATVANSWMDFVSFVDSSASLHVTNAPLVPVPVSVLVELHLIATSHVSEKVDVEPSRFRRSSVNPTGKSNGCSVSTGRAALPHSSRSSCGLMAVLPRSKSRMSCPSSPELRGGWQLSLKGGGTDTS
mmetsp:Transcript_21944/g.53821  ORF Transcript_21944/g.53821 Transcript_21944/m.53821 type:complete len:221 (+) Transcript_21944:728-1390(+)